MCPDLGVYCEEAIGFLESCSIESESYASALVRMYGRSVELVSRLSSVERINCLERLERLRSRAKNVGWAVDVEFNNLWYAADLDGQGNE